MMSDEWCMAVVGVGWSAVNGEWWMVSIGLWVVGCGW